jgi:hypothetical protein
MPHLDIRSLLDAPQEDPRSRARQASLERTSTTLGPFAGHMPVASADSLFRVLGHPINPIQIGELHRSTSGAEFDPTLRTIHFNPRYVADELQYARELVGRFGGSYERYVTEGDLGKMLAHETAHEATLGFPVDLDYPVNLSARRADIAGLMNAFFTRFEELPQEKKIAHLAAYEGLPSWRIDPNREIDDIDRVEILAATMERGYTIARRFDPNDPEKVSEAIQLADQRLPGTREAANFFIRSFLGLR